jgi:capsular polysaccharide biosynthesis protein
MENTKKQRDIVALIVYLTLFLIIGAAYFNFDVKNDYVITKQISCDPTKDSCFVSDCEVNDSSCDQKTTYKKIVASSKYAGSSYENFSCRPGDPHCRVITCEPDTIEDGEKCYK